MSLYSKVCELYEPPKPPTSIELNINLLNLAELIRWLVDEANKRKEAEPCGLFNLDLDFGDKLDRTKAWNRTIKEQIAAYKSVIYWVIWIIKQNHPNFDEEAYYEECGL
jgi:hypothetical protein